MMPGEGLRRELPLDHGAGAALLHDVVSPGDGLASRITIPYNMTIGKKSIVIESTITSKGQTTVPAEVREQIGATPGTRLVWHVMPDGSIVVRAKTKSILDLAGAFKPPRGKHVSIAEMNPWR